MAETEGIRIVKRKKGHESHHGGAWKVAYADFVTAMMAFFLVMWIVGLSDPIKKAIEGYFKDPQGFKGATGAKAAGKTESPTASPDERARLAAAKKAIEKMIMERPELKNLRKYVDIKLVPEGLRIDLLESKESMFFDSGSAKVKPGTVTLLARIASELKTLPNKLMVEGHTDSRPLNRADGYTNWELSADRANSARHIVEAAGVSDSQIAQVRGYAATQPRDPSNPAHYSNRRVSIVVVSDNALRTLHFGDKSVPDPDLDKKLPVSQSPAVLPH